MRKGAGDSLNMRFPDRFLWGAATSAYQIEGSPLADGAGAGIWHRFTHTRGFTVDGATGDVACDHYRRCREDVGLMKELGLQAYRFSLSWSRILPEGCGRVNPAGMDFYSRLLDRLLECGIQPFVTLYHWDLPAALQDRGGWLNPESVAWFAEYTQVVARAFGDRIPFWTTLNEPWVVVDAGFVHGVHAPGHRSLFEAVIAAHHLLRAHGAAVQALRSVCDQTVGLVVNIEPKLPASSSAEDVAAAELADQYMNRYFLDPIFFGAYPEGLRTVFGEAWVDFPQQDFAQIREPIDFLGINYYTRAVHAFDREGWPIPVRRVIQEGRLHTDMEWEVYPEGLKMALLWVKNRYGELPLYVTENGAAFAEPSSVAAARLEDPLRVSYLREHLLAAHGAILDGVDLRGYFAWSFMDNLEWASGFTKRFGLYHVDYASQRRVRKASAEFYGEVIRTNGGALSGPSEGA